MDLPGLVKARADALGYNFAYGSRQFLNYELTLQDLKEGKINILMFPESEVVNYDERAIPDNVEFTLTFQIAKKWETGNATKSNLDETYLQKHDLRLKDLKVTGKSFVKSLICQNDFEAISLTIDPEINVYAENLDLWNFRLVFRVLPNK